MWRDLRSGNGKLAAIVVQKLCRIETVYRTETEIAGIHAEAERSAGLEGQSVSTHRQLVQVKFECEAGSSAHQVHSER